MTTSNRPSLRRRLALPPSTVTVELRDSATKRVRYLLVDSTAAPVVGDPVVVVRGGVMRYDLYVGDDLGELLGVVLYEITKAESLRASSATLTASVNVN